MSIQNVLVSLLLSLLNKCKLLTEDTLQSVENSIVSFDGFCVIFIPVSIKLFRIVIPSSFLMNVYLSDYTSQLGKELLLHVAIQGDENDDSRGSL